MASGRLAGMDKNRKKYTMRGLGGGVGWGGGVGLEWGGG